MKKMIFLCLILFSVSYVYSQFEGYMEVKMTEKKSRVKSEVKSDENKMPGMEEALKMMKSELKEREEKLKSMKEGDEGYNDLKMEIEEMNKQLKNLSGVSESGSGDDTPKTETVKFYYAPKAVRIEQGQEKSDMGGISIVRTDTKKIIIITEKNKTYMELDFDFMKSMMAKMKEMGMKKEETKKGKSNVKKTGETKTILGYTCEKWMISDDESTSEAWVAHKFSNFFSIFGELGNSFMGGGGDDEGVFKEFSASNSFPLMAKEVSKDGKVLNEWEVIKIEKGKQPPALFQVPAGYQKMDLNQMMQQN
jgi:hypothetical protein